MKSYSAAIALILTLALGAGGMFMYHSYVNRLITSGELRIDPNAKIDPEREYKLVVWEHEVPLPWETGSHRTALEAAVEEFQRAYPNITVELTMFEWYDNHGKLREALERGTPPDVYGMPLGARMIDSGLQIPVDAYMSRESKEDHLPQALASLHFNGRVWAWPRWVLPHVWVAREDLSERLAHARDGWNAEELIETLAEVKQSTGAWGLVLNPYDPSLFVDVMVATTGKNLIGPQGERAWSTQDMERGLEFFHTLIERGLTERDPRLMSRTRLAIFWNRQAALVAPVNPWLLRHLLVRAEVLGGEEDDVESLHAALAVPPPSAGGAVRAHPATVSGYIVFRQEVYAGDDHTGVAMALAEHLSRRMGPWEASHLFAVPAHPTAWNAWREDSGLPEKELDLLISWAENALGPPVLDVNALKQSRSSEQIIAEEFAKVWQGVAPEQIAENIARRVDGLRATLSRP